MIAAGVVLAEYNEWHSQRAIKGCCDWFPALAGTPRFRLEGNSTPSLGWRRKGHLLSVPGQTNYAVTSTKLCFTRHFWTRTQTKQTLVAATFLAGQNERISHHGILSHRVNH